MGANFPIRSLLDSLLQKSFTSLTQKTFGNLTIPQVSLQPRCVSYQAVMLHVFRLCGFQLHLFPLTHSGRHQPPVPCLRILAFSYLGPRDGHSSRASQSYPLFSTYGSRCPNLWCVRVLLPRSRHNVNVGHGTSLKFLVQVHVQCCSQGSTTDYLLQPVCPCTGRMPLQQLPSCLFSDAGRRSFCTCPRIAS